MCRHSNNVTRCFGGTYRLHFQGIKNPRSRNQREQVAACIFHFIHACYKIHSSHPIVYFSLILFWISYEVPRYSVLRISPRLPFEVQIRFPILRSQTTSAFFSSLGCKINSGALVRKRTTPTERPPLVGAVSANFLVQELREYLRGDRVSGGFFYC
jgi:hypothetical protein